MIKIIQDIEARLLPELHVVANRLSRQYPQLKLHIFSGTVGAATPYQGYHIGVECLFPNIPSHEPDNLALSVDFQHLPSAPQMTADIVWGHPSGHLEAEWSDEWVTISEATIEQLFVDLPRLYQVFESTIERRYCREKLNK